MSEPKHALLVVDGYYLSQTNWRQKRDGHGELGMAELVSFLEQRHGISFYEKFYLDSTPDAPTPHHTATLNKLRHLGFDQSDDYKYKQQAVVSPSGERFTITVAAGVDVGICATLLQRGIGLKPMQSAVNISTIVLVAGDGDFKQPLKICKDFGKKLVLVFSRHLISGQIRQLAHSEVVLEDHWPSLTLSPQPPPPHRTAAPVATAVTMGATTTTQSGQGQGQDNHPLESIHTTTGGPNAAFFTRDAPELSAGFNSATVVDANSSSAARARQRWKQAKDQVMSTIRKRSNGSNSDSSGSVSAGGRNGADSVLLQRGAQPAPALAEMAMVQPAEPGPGPGTRYPAPPRRNASRYGSHPGQGMRPIPVVQSAATRRRACSGVPLPGPPPGRPPASLPRGVKPPRGPPPPRGANGAAGHGINGRSGVSRSQPNSARSHDGGGYAHYDHYRSAGTSIYESRLPAGTLSARSEAGVMAHSGSGSRSCDPLNGGHSVYGTMGHPAPPLPRQQPRSRPRPLPGQMPLRQPGVDQLSMGAGRGPGPRTGQRGSLSIVVDDPMVTTAAVGAATGGHRNGRNGTGNAKSGDSNKRKGTRASATDERLMATSLLSLEAAGDDADAVVAGLSELKGHVMVSQPAANAHITEQIVRLMGAFGTDGNYDASVAVQRSGLALLTAMASCGSDPDAVDKVIEGGGVESAKGIVAARCFNVDEDTVLAALELLNLLTAAPAPGATTKKQRAARAAAVAKARLMPVVLDATQRYQGSSLVNVCMGVLRNITSTTPSPSARSPRNFG